MEAVGIGTASLCAYRYSSGVSAAVVAVGDAVVVAESVKAAAGPALEPGDRLE